MFWNPPWSLGRGKISEREKGEKERREKERGRNFHVNSFLDPSTYMGETSGRSLTVQFLIPVLWGPLFYHTYCSRVQLETQFHYFRLQFENSRLETEKKREFWNFFLIPRSVITSLYDVIDRPQTCTPSLTQILARDLPSHDIRFIWGGRKNYGLWHHQSTDWIWNKLNQPD